IVPLQDLLGRGSDARMNVPGVAAGNWSYRVQEPELTPALAERLGRLCEIYERIPPSLRRSP
ncbi:MAG TPA: 4-alpha-glucanotransferase, partial [Polyangiaceae bacterium]|nr:4-alpha-glucanotransferase [Polyangiaceae bacterium]